MTTGARRRGALHPYCGTLDDRRASLGKAHEQRTCGEDRTGNVAYRYNTLGYRGDEPRPDARLLVFVFGESDAFGIGIAEHEAWPQLVARRVAAALGVTESDLSIVNFADVGASNAAIARAVITQCAAVTPDLVLINTADARRVEGVTNGRLFHIGPWFDDPGLMSREHYATRDPQQRQLIDEAIERGRHYLRFATAEQSRLGSLRDALLMQTWLADAQIPALATCAPNHEFVAAASGDAAPLAQQIDRTFLTAHDVTWPSPDRAADGTHFGPQAHQRIAEHVFSRLVTDGTLERLRQRLRPAETDPVRAFYEQLPFNRHGDVRDAVAAVEAHTLEHTYPDLHALLKSGRVRRVLEAGCGAGWLTATMARHYGVAVTAVDFCTASLDCARQLAKALRIDGRVQFVECDLFEHQNPDVDLVVSIGVLHHTRDCAAAFRHVARFAAPWLYVGLYHEPGRRPFLGMFEQLLAERGEQAAFERYRQLDGVHAGDETMLRSWFRDQVLHPRETQHTLREVCGWLDAGGFALRSTSVNRFAALPPREELFSLEQTFAERSRQANVVEGRYFPGFFTVLAERL